MSSNHPFSGPVLVSGRIDLMTSYSTCDGVQNAMMFSEKVFFCALCRTAQSTALVMFLFSQVIQSCFYRYDSSKRSCIGDFWLFRF